LRWWLTGYRAMSDSGNNIFLCKRLFFSEPLRGMMKPKQEKILVRACKIL